MKKKIQLMLLLVVFFTSPFAQAIIVKQTVAGGSKAETLASSFQTKDGGMIAGGSSNSDISGEKTEASKGGSDYWVIKYDKDGNIVWNKTFGGDQNDVLAVVKQTKDEGYILAGTSVSGISGDKSEAGRDDAGLSNGGDFWLVKIDKNGNKQWNKTLGGNLMDSLAAIEQTDDGGYIIGGYSRSAATGDKSENSRGLEDYWVIKFSKTGTIEWDKTFGGSQSDRLAAVDHTSDGGYLIGGTSSSGIENEKTEASYGQSDYWVLKLSASGDVQWDKSLGGSGQDILVSAEQTITGDYFIAGSSSSPVSGVKKQKNRGAANTYDYWIVRIDVNGNIINSRTFGGNSDDIMTSASQASGGGFMLGGFSKSSKSGEKSEDSRGGFDYWAVYEWGGPFGRIYKDKTLGGTEDDFATSVAEANYHEFWLGGYSSSDISGDKTEAPRGKSDYWMIYIKDERSLPVSFSNVKAFQQGTGVKVLWTSLSEINVAKYEIQRSSDGVNFRSIGMITPSSNAAKQVDYDYFDQHPVNGNNYYRIKSTDLDGKETLTITILVIIRGKAALILYPNPVKDVLNIQLTGKAALSLINQNGDVVLSKTIENTGSINVAHLPAGVYYLRNNATGEKTQVVIAR